MIFLGFGSNIGNRELCIEKAWGKLAEKGVKILRTSGFYETAAWGKTDQADFINAVAEVEFEGSPLELLKICLQVEVELGRERTEKWGPRTIDIDLIDFHQVELKSAELTLPHPFYTSRDFVMTPLRELEPDWEIDPMIE